MKYITLKLKLTSENSNYDLCEFITQVILNSALSNTIYNTEVIECKVETDEHTTDRPT